MILEGIEENNKAIAKVRETLLELKVTKGEFDQWKPQMETNVLNLQSSVADLRVQVEQILSKPGSTANSMEKASLTLAPGWGATTTTHLDASSIEATFGPHVHHVAQTHRGMVLG